MKRIKVISEVYISCNRNVPANELALNTEMALNGMGPVDMRTWTLLGSSDKVTVRFHFEGKPPEVIIGEEEES